MSLDGGVPLGGAVGAAPFSACARLIASAVLSPGRLSILGLAAAGGVAGVTGGAVVVGVAGVPAAGLAAAGADPGKGCPGLFLTTAGTLTFGGTVGCTPDGVTTGGLTGTSGGFVVCLPNKFLAPAMPFCARLIPPRIAPPRPNNDSG